jgi:hypothetical protein
MAEYLAVPEKLGSTMGHAAEAVLVAPVGNRNLHIVHAAGSVAFSFCKSRLFHQTTRLPSSAQVKP